MALDLDTLQATDLLIGGRWRTGGNGRFDDVAPRNGAVFATAPDGDVEDMQAAVGAARQAFDSGPWPRMSPQERSKCLGQLAAALGRNEALFAELASVEWGVTNDRFAQVNAPTFIAAGSAQLALVPTEESVTGADGSTGRVIHAPEGVVAAIAPWNYPHVLNLTKVTSAIAAGNTVVLKPSPLTPLVALAVARLVKEETDIPDGVVNVVTTSSLAAAQALTEDDRVDMITFTGSAAVGKQIAASAARTLKRLVLELGGKSPAIHLDDLTDADYEQLGPRTLFEGCTRHSGQACILTSRLLVPARRHDAIVERLVALAESVVVGDPLSEKSEMGPMISRTQTDNVLRQVREAVAAGATIATGGKRLDVLEDGSYLAPTILTEVTNDMAVARQELFGPVLAVIPYQDDEEAVAIANDTQYGLVGAVFGAEVDRAERIAERLRAGQVTVNGSMALGPVGGFRESGLGREQGLAGLREYTETKTVSRPGPAAA
jgi:acyl-CoA reductase-like NAD-dependent aldehyde dehydrogenase